jgi:xanthine dehydrogenase YagS FAD-binding subunit
LRLTVLDAVIDLQGVNGERRVPIADFYRLPGNTPHIETVLQPGEMITAPSWSPQRRATRIT